MGLKQQGKRNNYNSGVKYIKNGWQNKMEQIQNIVNIFQSQFCEVIVRIYISLNLNDRMDKYEELENIGKGQFGAVKKIKRVSDGRILVWKEVNYSSMSRQQKNQLVNQVNILKDLAHDNIVKYFNHFVDKKSSKVYIVMEHCPGGDLGSLISDLQKKTEYLDEEVVWRLFFQLISALNYCHRKKILHRDLKPANIFIDSTRNNIKVGDFGLSRELGEHSQYAKTYVGTPYYMSPQQICVNKYNQKSDIWSLGCILYELCALHRPFRASNIIELSKKIENGVYEPLSNRYSYNLRNIINKMLAVNSDNRPSSSDLLSIPQLSIRAEERQMKQQYEQLKKIQEELKKKQEEYRQKIYHMEELSRLKVSNTSKRSTSTLDWVRGKASKTLTISI